MAVLGVNLIISLVAVSVIQKFGYRYSFGSWLLCSTGLYRYLYPTNQELRQLAGVPKDKSKKSSGKNESNFRNRKNGDSNAVETFQIPKNLDINLQTIKIVYADVVHLKYYIDYQWILDFSIYALLVYVITEVVQCFVSTKNERVIDVNLSIIWCLLVVGFCFKILVSLTKQYFKNDESIGERSTVIVTFFSYLLIAMIILIVDENILETGLDQAHRSFNQSAYNYLKNQGFDTSGPASKIVLNFCIAIWCALVGALCTFPGLRIARMHWDLLKRFKDRKLIQLLLNINFAMPFIITILWIKPISRHYLTVRVFSGMDAPLMTTNMFDSVRLLLLITTIVSRFVLMPTYLQTYLNMAKERVVELKKEAGRISNVDLQKKVAAIFFYLCVVALQYITPVLLCLFLTCMYKTLGGYNWNPLADRMFAESSSQIQADEILDVSDEMNGFVNIASLRSIFSTEVFRGVLGFLTWWCCFVWFTTTSLGMLYQTYFSNVS